MKPTKQWLNLKISFFHRLRSIKELIKFKASQINGCAFCIEMHTADAIKNGETIKRFFALSAWWESLLFTDKEKTVLAMTENRQ